MVDKSKCFWSEDWKGDAAVTWEMSATSHFVHHKSHIHVHSNERSRRSIAFWYVPALRHGISVLFTWSLSSEIWNETCKIYIYIYGLYTKCKKWKKLGRHICSSIKIRMLSSECNRHVWCETQNRAFRANLVLIYTGLLRPTLLDAQQWNL